MPTVIAPCSKTYQTPPGTVDQMYIYGFNGTHLTAGGDFPNQHIHVKTGSDFICRRVVGLSSIIGFSGQYRMKDGSGAYLSSAPVGPAISLVDFIHYPEVTYQNDSSIAFDVLGVPAASGLNIGQIAFFGVNRWAGVAEQSVTPWSLDQHPRFYEISVSIPITWAFNNANPTRRFAVEFTSYAFDWYTTQIQNAYTANSVAAASLTFYTANRYSISNIPILASYFSDPVPDGQPYYPVLETGGLLGLGYPVGAIVPPISYPQLSEMYIDVTSLLPVANVPQTMTILLKGVQRIPGAMQNALCL